MLLNQSNNKKLSFKLGFILVLMVGIGSLHFFTDGEMFEAYQHFYYLPIILAGIWFGIVGGLIVSVVISITYILELIVSPFNVMGLYSEILFYLLIGIGTGFLVNMEKKQSKKLEKTSEELSETHSKLQETFEMLRQSDRLAVLGELAAGLTHEIRNPLGSIKGAVDIIENEVGEDNPKFEFVLIMKDEIERLDHLLKEFTLYAKPPELELRKANINEIIYPVISLIRATTNQENIRIISEFDNQLPTLIVDSEQLKQVFFNIILNGVQSMSSGGNLRITTTSDHNHLEVSIADEGTGIEAENIRRIFDPFFTTKENGTGLGLSISYQLIKKHGGNIDVKQNPNQGVTFIVKLPLENSNGN